MARQKESKEIPRTSKKSSVRKIGAIGTVVAVGIDNLSKSDEFRRDEPNS